MCEIMMPRYGMDTAGTRILHPKGKYLIGYNMICCPLEEGKKPVFLVSQANFVNLSIFAHVAHIYQFRIYLSGLNMDGLHLIRTLALIIGGH